MTHKKGKQIAVSPLADNASLDGLFHFEMIGLSNYWLAPELVVRQEVNGEMTCSFPEFDNISAAIGLHLCDLPRLLGPKEVRWMRHELGHTQEKLGTILGYGDRQCVAKAESETGKRLSPSADELLRHAYLAHLIKDEIAIANYLIDEARQRQLEIRADRLDDGFVELLKVA